MSAATVEQIIRDLVEVAIAQTRERKRKDVQARAQLAAEERVLDALVGANSSAATRDSFRKKLRAGELNTKEIEVETQSSGGMPMFEIPGMPGAQMGRHLDRRYLRQDERPDQGPARLTVEDSHELLVNEEVRQAVGQRSAGAGIDQCGREQRHRVSRRDRQDLCP